MKSKLRLLFMVGVLFGLPLVAHAKCEFLSQSCYDYFGYCNPCVDDVYLYDCGGYFLYEWHGCCLCT